MSSASREAGRLRSLHSSFSSPKEVNQSDALPKADKLVLFQCMRIPQDERDQWFDGEACRLLVAQKLAKRSEPSQLGFPVASGRLVLCGAPGKNDVQTWAKELNCVVTLLREDELRDRGLQFVASLPPLGVEWLHHPISGAALRGDGDRSAVMAAANAVVEQLRLGRTVAVHCSAGLHRTGIVAYMALRLLGFSLASAFELLGRVRWETRAELEKLHFRNQPGKADATAKLVAVAEEMLVGCCREERVV